MRTAIRCWTFSALSAALLAGGVNADESSRNPAPDDDWVSRGALDLVSAKEPVASPASKPVMSVPAAGPTAGEALGAYPTAPCASSDTCGFYAGAGVLYLRPYVSNNAAYTLITPPAAPSGGGAPLAIGSALEVPFDWGHGLGYQAWIGASTGAGWGVRAGAFCFDHGSELLTLVNQPALPQLVTVPGVIPAIPGAAGFGAPTSVLAAAGIGQDRLAFRTDLEIQSYDLEGTHVWGDSSCVVLVSAGARCTTLRQEYHAFLINTGDGVTSELQRLDSVREFTGAGPTVGLSLRYGAQNGLAGYGNVRGSLLFGELERSASFVQNINDPNLAALVGTQQTRTRFDSTADHVLTIGEFEAGLEYGVVVGGSRMFVRGGVVAQGYFNAGSATGSTGTLGLFGGIAAVGVDY